ncbi:unnamed protein product [Sphagnum balticum]
MHHDVSDAVLGMSPALFARHITKRSTDADDDHKHHMHAPGSPSSSTDVETVEVTVEVEERTIEESEPEKTRETKMGLADDIHNDNMSNAHSITSQLLNMTDVPATAQMDKWPSPKEQRVDLASSSSDTNTETVTHPISHDPVEQPRHDHSDATSLQTLSDGDNLFDNATTYTIVHDNEPNWDTMSQRTFAVKSRTPSAGQASSASEHNTHADPTVTHKMAVTFPDVESNIIDHEDAHEQDSGGSSSDWPEQDRSQPIVITAAPADDHTDDMMNEDVLVRVKRTSRPITPDPPRITSLMDVHLSDDERYKLELQRRANEIDAKRM